MGHVEIAGGGISVALHFAVDRTNRSGNHEWPALRQTDDPTSHH